MAEENKVSPTKNVGIIDSIKQKKALIPEFIEEEALRYSQSLRGLGYQQYVDVEGARNLSAYIEGSWRPQDTDIAAALAYHQPLGEAWRNALGQFVNLAGVGLASSFDYDFEDFIDMAQGENRMYGSMISNWADSRREEIMEKYPIYHTASWGDGKSWASMTGQLGFSAGLIGGTVGQAMALSAVGGSLVPALANIGKIGKLSSVLKTVGLGSIQGLHNARLNALDIQQELYQKATLEAGLSPEEAEKIAGAGASLAFKYQAVPLMLLNTVQWGLLNKFVPGKGLVGKHGVSTSSGLGSVLEVPGEYLLKALKVDGKYAKGISSFGLSMISEGGEEYIEESLVPGIVQNKLLRDTGLIYESADFWNWEAQSAIVSGMLAGGFFKGLGDGLNKIRSNFKLKEIKKDMGQFSDNLFSSYIKTMQDIAKATEEGDTEKVQDLRIQLSVMNPVKSLQYDFFTEGTFDVQGGSFDSYINKMAQAVSAIESNNQEELEALGLTDAVDIQAAKRDFKTYLKNALSIKQKMHKAQQEFGNPEIAFDIAKKEFVLEELSEGLKAYDTFIEKVKTEDTLFESLDANQKAILQNELDLAKYKRKAEKGQLTTTEEKEAFKALKEEQQNLLEAEEVFFGEMGLENTTLFEVLNQVEKQREVHQEKLREAKRKVSEARTTKNIKEVLRQSQEDRVKRAKNKEEVQQALKNSTKYGTETEKLKQQGQAKVDKLDTEEKLGQQQKEPKASTKKAQTVLQKAQQSSAKRQQKTTTAREDLVAQEDIISDTYLSPEVQEDNDLVKAIKETVEALKEELERDTITFTDFITTLGDALRNSPDKKALFKEIARTWDSNVSKIPKQELEKLYREYISPLGNLVNKVISTTQRIVNGQTKSEAKVTEDSIKETKTKATEKVEVGKDENGEAEIISDRKTATSELSAGFLNLAYETVVFEDAEGNQTTVRRTVGEELIDDPHIQSKQILLDTELNPGETLVIEVAEEADVIPVSVYENSNVVGANQSKQEKPFGELERSKYNPDGTVNKNWARKVPMIAYKVDSEGNKTPMFYIHDEGWYNPDNISNFDGDIEKQIETIKEGRKNINELRQRVAEGGQVQITITEKSRGSFETFQEEDIETLPTIEDSFKGNKNNEVTMVFFRNGQFWKDSETPFEGKVNLDGHLPESGRTYAIRKGTTKGSYILDLVIKPSIYKNKLVNSADTVYNFLKAILEKDQKVLEEIQKITGLNIFSVEKGQVVFTRDNYLAINNLLNAYTKISKPTGIDYSLGAMEVKKQLEQRAVANKDTEKRIVQVGGMIFFGNNGKYNIISLSSGKVGNLPILKSFLSPTKSAGVTELSAGSLVANLVGKNIFSLDGTGKVVEVAYDSFLRDSYVTYLKTYNAGTSSEPRYVTAIQPRIHFKPTEDSANVVEDKTNTEVDKVEQQLEKEPLEKLQIIKDQSTSDTPSKNVIEKVLYEKLQEELGDSPDKDFIYFLQNTNEIKLVEC